MTSNVKTSLPSRMYGLFPWEWPGLAEITLANFSTIYPYFTLYCVSRKTYHNKNAVQSKFLSGWLTQYLNMEKKCRILKSVTYNVHTCKHSRMCQNKQGRHFQILLTCLNANDPTAQVLPTNKNSCLISFGKIQLIHHLTAVFCSTNSN